MFLLDAAVRITQDSINPREITTITRKPNILIIEDDPITRFMMGEICDQLGFPYEQAASGTQCLEMVQNSPSRADILLMDIHMPGLSGLETCANLRDLLNGQSHIPVIYALTADEFWQNPVHSTAAGFDGVLGKPISIEGVRQALQGAAVKENCYTS